MYESNPGRFLRIVAGSGPGRPEIQQHQSHQEQRRRNDNARFQKEHAEYLAAACPVAFMHAYRFGTVCK